MNILFLGDIMGRSGRDALAEHLPNLRKNLKLDFVIVNAENAGARPAGYLKDLDAVQASAYST